jgi:hypothetical protein
MRLINEDEYTPTVVYEPGAHTFTKEQIGIRYLFVSTRMQLNPSNVKDLVEVHQLQDAIKVKQQNAGKFEIPKWASNPENGPQCPTGSCRDADRLQTDVWY